MKTKFLIVAIFIAMLSIGVASADIGGADHTAAVTLTPDEARCGTGDELTDFSVTVQTLTGFPIYQVKVPKPLSSIDELECGPAPTGWQLLVDSPNLCQWQTDPFGTDVLEVGDPAVTFTFKASLDDDPSCASTFRITTLDNEAITQGTGTGQELTHERILEIDCTPPLITKTVNGAKVPIDDACTDNPANNEDGVCDWWIRQTDASSISILADDSEDRDECNLGVDYCRWKLVLDGQVYDGSHPLYDVNYCTEMGGTVDGDWCILQNGETLEWSFDFEEDSEHEITVECYDEVKNMASFTELDKVDDTPPITTKTLNEPKKEVPIPGTEYSIEWIDTKSSITLDPVDPNPAPEGYQCNIGVDKTWYMNSVFEEPEVRADTAGPFQYCYEPHIYCNGNYLDDLPRAPSTECMMDAQDFCESDEGFTPETDDWYNCVESYVHDECDYDEGWKLYRGEPIKKNEQSCHVLRYFSVDHLGNTEEMQYNCFFVDKTPPMLEKVTMDEKVPLCQEDNPMRDASEYLETVTQDEMTLIGKGGEYDVTVTKEWDCDGLLFTVQFDEADIPTATTTAAIVVIGNRTDPLFQLGWNSQSKTNFEPDAPVYGEYDGGWQPLTDVLPAGMTVTGDLDGYYYEIFVPLEYVPQLYSWAINVEATDPSTFPHSSSVQRNYPADWTRWTGEGMAEDASKDWWVTKETDIRFTCDDIGPHPSEGEELCMKVSFDNATGDGGYGFITPQYCAKYDSEGAYMDGDYCCIPFENRDLFDLNFDEESLHDLEYFCRDAVDKGMDDVHLQYYRVDHTPPIIEKTMVSGPFVGDCLPPNGDDTADCYVNEESVIGIRAYDPDPTGMQCAVEDLSCRYVIYWEVDESTCVNAGYEYNGALDLCVVEADSFTEYAEVSFTEDSTHQIYVTCQDALGNAAEDREWFRVDLTPPETVKTYGEPRYPFEGYASYWVPSGPEYCEERCDDDIVDLGEDGMTCMESCLAYEGFSGYARWITTATNITLEAFDEKVNQGTTYWRNLYVPDDEMGEYICGHRPRDIDGDLTVKNMIRVGDWCEPDIYLEAAGVDTGWDVQFDYNEDTDLGPDWVTSEGGRVDIDTVGGEMVKAMFNGNRVYEFSVPLSEMNAEAGDFVKLFAYLLDGTQSYDRTLNVHPDGASWGDTGDWRMVELKEGVAPIVIDGDLSDWGAADFVFTDTTATKEKPAPAAPVTREFSLYLRVYDGMLYVGIDFTGDVTDDVDSEGRVSIDGAKVAFENDAPWKPYLEPFQKEEESCHIIEYYSDDALGNTEDLQWQCVFVDDTPPTGIKEVGFPSINISEGGDAACGEAVIYRPGPGMNDGSDEGTLDGGKDTSVSVENSYPSRENFYGSAMSDCNPTSTKGYIQFDVSTLPEDVENVYLGVHHIAHTEYCYSGCSMDFYIYALTSPWSETETTWSTQPSEGEQVYGPIHIEFPNDFGNKEYEITEIYRKWKDGSMPNYGLVVYSPDVVCNNAAVLFSVESSDATEESKRPYLKVETGDCDGGGIDWFVNQETPITITCEDPAPHPSDHEQLCFKVSFEGDSRRGPVSYLTENYCAEFGGNYDTLTEECCIGRDLVPTESATVRPGPAGATYELTFLEDSIHNLEFWCEDALGNEGEVDIEWFAVDTVPPVTTKTYTGPVHTVEVCPDDLLDKSSIGANVVLPPECWTERYIDNVTRIVINGSDPFPHPAGFEQAWYRYTLVDDEYCRDAEGDAVFEDHGRFDLSGYNIWYVNGKTSDEASEYESSTDNPGEWEYVTGPYPTPLGYGSLRMSIDNAGVAFRSFAHAGMKLSDLTTLEYSTYSVNGNSYPTLQLEWDQDCVLDSYDGNLIFIPSDNTDVEGDAATPGEWQTWNALDGTWTWSSDFSESWTWSELLTEFPNACIRPDFGRVGVKVGTESTTETTYTDALIVNEMVYDMESQGTFLPYEGKFGIPEESCHMIEHFGVDRLGNTELVKRQYVFADHSAPEIVKWYDGPVSRWYSPEEYEYPHYISVETLVDLSATFDVEPHPSGISEIWYRWGLQNDTMCENQTLCEADGGCWENETHSGYESQEFGGDAHGWILWNGTPFVIPEESCHIIEIRAVDNVNKTSYHKQCVYVDDTPPEPKKTPGEPVSPMSLEDQQLGEAFYPGLQQICAEGDENTCLDVTVLTPINLSCVDGEPHPSGRESICFMVELDGEDATEEYCEYYGDEDSYNETSGYCCVDSEITDFRFLEETWHKLDYYCIDAVGNVGEEHDVEYFKVGGSPFTIPLYKKWNLISVPFVLKESDPATVFGELEHVDMVWAYDPSNPDADSNGWLYWSTDGPQTISSVQPGFGYWVLMRDDEELLIAGDLIEPAKLPPERELQPGWNLIGYYGTNWEYYPDYDSDPTALCADGELGPDFFGPEYLYGSPVYCALNSLVDTQQGFPRWSSLWGYQNCGVKQGSSVPGFYGLNTCVDQPSLLRLPWQQTDRMYAGKGYWVELDVEDRYVPATTCVWNRLNSCVVDGPWLDDGLSS